MRIPSTLAPVAPFAVILFAVVLLALALLALAAAPLSAQPGDTLISATDTSIFEISGGGVILQTLITVPGANSYIRGLTPSLDNRGFCVSWIHGAASQYNLTFTKMDRFGVVTTVWTGPHTFVPTALFPDFDGNWMMATGYGHILRLRGSTLTTLMKFTGQTGNGSLYNEETGKLIFRGQSGFSSTLIGGFFALDMQRRTVTTLATCHYLSMGVSQLLYEADTGSYVDTHRIAQIPPPVVPAVSTLVRVTASTGLVPFAKQSLSGYTTALVAVGPRSPTRAYYALERNWPSTTVQTSVLTKLLADGARLSTTVIQGYPQRSSYMGMIRKESRHLTWSLTKGPNDRLLRVSFPREPGRAYVVGLSLTGVRPGIVLRDARVIPLVPDNLTKFCLAGGAPGLLERTVGVLDLNGEAKVRVNLNPLGSQASGLRLWATVMVLDPNAPLGIAAIRGPLLLQGK